jgi:hypothetical protein
LGGSDRRRGRKADLQAALCSQHVISGVNPEIEAARFQITDLDVIDRAVFVR